jgi:phage tail sheath protein FI
MSVTTSYPGVYIQELSSNSHAIVPAPTSIAAFVGYSHPFQTQAFNVAQQLFSFSDYETYFGPLFSSGLVDASLPRAVYQFFLNGGSNAYVVGLQPGLFDKAGDIINRLGAQNGGEVISADTSGGASAGLSFAVNAANPVPSISSLSPSSALAGGAAFELIINGANFVSGSTVTFNGQPLTPVNFVNSSQLTVEVPTSDIPAAAGPVSVVVSNPGPGGGPTPTGFAFAFSSTNPAPTVASISPTSVTLSGASSFKLTINGGNFVAGSTVMFNGHALSPVSFVSPSELQANVPTADLPATAGPVNVVVSNPTPGGGAAPAAIFTLNATNAVPTISSLSPSSVTMGVPQNLTLTVNGANFVTASHVVWNGNPLATTYVSDTQLTAIVTPSLIAAAGAASVTVSSPTPGGGASAAFAFAINSSNPVPTISSLSPVAVLAGAAAFTLTVNGAGFVSGSTVTWNGAKLATTYVNPSQLTASVPATDVATAGAFNVTVANSSNGIGIVFTAQELTDIVPMTVTIANVRNGGATFDIIVTYGSRIETYRGIQLGGAPSLLPDAVINKASKLIQVAADTGGYPSVVAPQQLSIAFDIPTNLNSCFNAADFIVGDETSIAIFEPNSKLDNVEIFNLLMVPGVTDFSVVSAGLAFAERKRAFMIVDPPPQSPAFGSSIATPQPIQYWMEGLYGPSGPSLPLSQNGAIYFPYLTSNDPVTGNNIPMAPSGFVSGIYASTDASRGVWKAPAGLATTVLNTVGPVLAGVMNDPQQGVLNLDSINCLRGFSGVGTVVWGARTLVADNQAFQQWMYVPVRRMTLFIEQTLVANLRWVVFEPNDEPLWVAITSSISAFMLSLFRQGALQGSTPSQAFQVKCDSTTTSSTDQQNGIVNIVVAFAPLKPAEFVVVQIAQLAGQTAGS